MFGSKLGVMSGRVCRGHPHTSEDTHDVMSADHGYFDDLVSSSKGHIKVGDVILVRDANGDYKNYRVESVRPVITRAL